MAQQFQFFIQALTAVVEANKIIARTLSSEKDARVIKTKEFGEISVWQFSNQEEARIMAGVFNLQGIKYRIWRRLGEDGTPTEINLKQLGTLRIGGPGPIPRSMVRRISELRAKAGRRRLL
jgi:hypothetical protein